MTQPTAKMCAFHCGRPAHLGKRLCKTHLEHQRLKMAEYRVGRKQAGLCSRCPNPARVMLNGERSTLCERCRTQVRTLEQLERSKYTRMVKRVIRAKASGKTLKEIGAKEGLPPDEIRQILVKAASKLQA